MKHIDYEAYRRELTRRRAELGLRVVCVDPTRLTHKPRHPFKRQWLLEHDLLTIPNEAPGAWKPKFRKPE